MFLLYRSVEIKRGYSMVWRWICVFDIFTNAKQYENLSIEFSVYNMYFGFWLCFLTDLRYCMQYTMRHHNCLLFLHSGNKTFIFPQCEKHCLWQNPVFKGWKCNKLEYSFASLCTCNSLVTNMIYWNTNRINLFAKQYWHMYNITLTWSCFQFIDLARR